MWVFVFAKFEGMDAIARRGGGRGSASLDSPDPHVIIFIKPEFGTTIRLKSSTMFKHHTD